MTDRSKKISIVALAAAALSASCHSHAHTASTPAPASTQTIQRQVTNAIDAGDGDIEVRALRQKLVANPDDLATRLELAAHYQKSGVPELAIEHYRLALARFPDNSDVAMRLARSLRDFDRPEDAIDVLVKFCNQHPKPAPELLSLLGILRDDAGKFGEAERAYRAALEQEPKQAGLHNNLGYNLLLQGRAQEATAEFEEALKTDPHSQLIHDNLAMALLAQWKDDSQPKEALLHWQSVSDPASAHNNLAAVLIQQHRYPEARKELEIALSYRADHPSALSNLRLVAALDGGPVTAPKHARHPFWARVRKILIGTTDASPAVQAAAQ
jgi:Flp pilus assembly protein TadD